MNKSLIELLDDEYNQLLQEKQKIIFDIDTKLKQLKKELLKLTKAEEKYWEKFDTSIAKMAKRLNELKEVKAVKCDHPRQKFYTIHSTEKQEEDTFFVKELEYCPECNTEAPSLLLMAFVEPEQTYHERRKGLSNIPMDITKSAKRNPPSWIPKTEVYVFSKKL